MNKKITYKNLIPLSIYFCVRNVIEGTWINDREQYLYPKDTWQRIRFFALHTRFLIIVLLLQTALTTGFSLRRKKSAPVSRLKHVYDRFH